METLTNASELGSVFASEPQNGKQKAAEPRETRRIHADGDLGTNQDVVVVARVDVPISTAGSGCRGDCDSIERG